MQLYLYKIRNNEGRLYWGIEEALNLRELKKQLRSNEYFFISAEVFDYSKLKKIKISVDELLMFTHRLSYLIDAGLPIIQSLGVLWKQSDLKEIQIVISYIRKQLEEGATLYEAFKVFPGVFPPMYLALISVAEVGAGLVKVLKKIAQYLEEQKQFKIRIQKATTYPSFVIGFAFLVIMALFIFVVPTFEKVILKLHGQLPLITKIIFGISKLIRNPIFILSIFILGIVSVISWTYVKQLRSVIYKIDEWKLKLPLANKIIYPLTIAKFTRSMGLLIESGVPLIMAIDVAKNTVVNKKVEQSITSLTKIIVEGGSIYEAFNSAKIFPVMMVDMLGIGETSGKLHKLLENVSNYLEEEADMAISKFLTYLEPTLIIFLGATVLIVMLAIYLPVFSIQSMIRGM